MSNQSTAISTYVSNNVRAYVYNVKSTYGRTYVSTYKATLCRNNMVANKDEYSSKDIYVASIIEKFTKLTNHQYKTIGKVHNSTVGHYGLERTLKRLKNLKEVWKFQRHHVRFFIDNCPCC